MSKGLEALENLKDTIIHLDYGFISKEDCEWIEAIKKELKALEIIKNNLCDFEFYDCEDDDDGENNGHYYLTKIKGKGYLTRYAKKVTKEEYDLLKEALE